MTLKQIFVYTHVRLVRFKLTEVGKSFKR